MAKANADRLGVRLLMALKGFPLPAAFPTLAPYVEGVTASGLFEARLGKLMGREVHVHAPAYAADEIDDLCGTCTHIVFNSLSQLRRFGPEAKARGLSVGLRLNPGFSSADCLKYDPCCPDSRFGVMPEELERLDEAERTAIFDTIDGLHVHALCEGYADDFAGMVERLAALLPRLCTNRQQPATLKWINLGVNGLRLDAVMWIYQCHTDANVKFLSEWYNHCNATYKARGGKGDFYMVGEAYDWNADVVAPYYKGLPSLFDFAYFGTVKDRINRGSGQDLGATIKSFQDKNRNAYANASHTHKTGFEDAIKLSNHDEDRVASDLGNHPQKKRLAGAILLTSPGKPYIYQGEELGYWGVKSSGDQNVRQPINWSKDCVVPTSWCSFDKSVITSDLSVEAQAADEHSLLQLYRHFAYARNTHSALAEGEIETTSSGNGAVAVWYMKSASEKVLVMHNLSSAPVTGTRDSDKLDKIIVSNHKVEVSGKSVTLPAYSSVVFQQ